MNPDTLLHIAGAALEALPLAMRSAQHYRDFLAINQVCSSLLQALRAIEHTDYFVREIRDKAREIAGGLRVLQAQSNAACDDLQPSFAA